MTSTDIETRFQKLERSNRRLTALCFSFAVVLIVALVQGQAKPDGTNNGGTRVYDVVRAKSFEVVNDYDQVRGHWGNYELVMFKPNGSKLRLDVLDDARIQLGHHSEVFVSRDLLELRAGASRPIITLTEEDDEVFSSTIRASGISVGQVWGNGGAQLKGYPSAHFWLYHEHGVPGVMATVVDKDPVVMLADQAGTVIWRAPIGVKKNEVFLPMGCNLGIPVR